MTTEEELKQIDFEIKRLKVQYDLYFSGASPRPPHDQRDALGRQLRRFQGVSMTNMSERFLYNSVVNKFNTFQELWIKMTRIKEEGARVHPLAARAGRRSANAGATGSVPSPAGGTTAAVAATPGAGSAASAGPTGASKPAAASAAARAAAGAADAAAHEAWRIRPAGGDQPELRALYDSYLKARRGVGEARPVAFDTFAREVARHAAAIQGKSDCEAVEFRIYSRDNKVTLKARPAGRG
jgi:hypothetical protein